MSEHTPGHWEIVREDDGRFIDIVDVNGDGILSTLRYRNAESAANIHLLAAAPDLLAALKEIAEGCISRPPAHLDVGKNRTKAEIESIALAAIARAEGLL